MNALSLIIHAQADDQASDEPIAPPKRRPRWQMPYGQRPWREAAAPKDITPEWADAKPGEHPALPLRPPGRSK